MRILTERLRASPEARAAPSGRGRPTAADCGLLLIRLVFGLLMAGHGAQKLFGLFGGQGLSAVAKGFAALGYRPGMVYAVLGGASEFLGGLGLALGLLTPLAAAALIGVMINAMVTVTAAHGLWDFQGGVEYNVCIAAVALAVAAIGPGGLAVDRWFRWGRGGWPQAAVALLLGGVGAAVVLAL
ncbi:DoxX family protein [Streptantibioticus cattleyicolor]|uniref:DoxX n=1 Tax=Streptantibioticus cattleyicolor (strain ATCC 35852 / DSM 46488 / JCM 4925 / NBRC 14057 / NRRL 8057) TaxID=1003195 RepID=F8JJ75_STREN|nr:DoxX family protein [Streptantibioticus cattleyicolor]AEW98817.1 DoxX [Streptantibioticus cattleyicolor NRRL 8057 = DSM 46488]CCB72134.1 putative membrane protein [Streptantibioticus cattleyicolor NRRL 8057 = DSM 46488]